MDESALTDYQREDRRRLRRYIEREDLHRIMNDTKWREAIALMRTLPPDFPVWFRAKCVRDPEARACWESDFPWHFPYPYAFIEWADFRTVVTRLLASGGKEVVADRTAEIVRGLREHAIPFTFLDEVPWGFAGRVVRIWGYLRPGATVVLEGA